MSGVGTGNLGTPFKPSTIDNQPTSMVYNYIIDNQPTNQMPTETTIILAVIGMLGLFSTATVFQRANRISSRYYKNK